MALQYWFPLIQDSRQQGLNSTISTTMGTGITFVVGKLGKAAQFPNSCNSCINVPGLKLQTGSWAAWIKVLGSGTTARQCLISEGRDSYNDGVEFYTNQAGTTLYFKAHTVILSTTIALNTWYHVVGTFGNNNIKLYVDGVLKASNTYTDDMTYTYSNDRFVLGKMAYSYANTSNYFAYNGCLNDVRVYDHVLSQMEVKQISQGLILHYPLDNNGFGNENLVLNSDTFAIGSGASGITPSTTSDGLHQVIAASGNSNWHASWATSTATSLLENTFAEGDPFTISFTIKSENANKTNPPDIYVKNGMGYYSMQGSVTSNWSTVYYSGTWKDTNSISFHLGFSGRTGTYLFKNWKVEKGLKPTPWCPHKDDELATTMGMNDGIEYDCSGFGNNGTRVGNFSWSSDTPRYLTSTHFTSTLSNAIIAPVMTLNMSNITIATWGKFNAFNYWSRIWDFGTAANGGGYDLCLANQNSSGKLMLAGRGPDKQTIDTLIKELTVNTWYHIVIVLNNGTCSAYINGILEKTFSVPGGDAGQQTLILNNLGKSNWTADKYFDGDISDFRIYTTALSASDIQSLYQNSAYIDSSGNVYGAVHEEV